MISAELKIGRTFGIRFEHGKDFMAELEEFCKVNNIKQGYVPFFSGDFSEITIVATCSKTEHPEAPMLNSKAYFENVETFGCGTIAYDKETEKILPHFHISIGSRLNSAVAHTSHFISGKVQFLIEMVFVEVLSPSMERIIDENVFNLKLLDFI
ncbi:DNA-binding protein [Clostridium sp. PL3]|uniref:DNA-binding protein n=1 Tax=Clostridium thailandense TaxID=2794346 RepID=A0A949U5K9_9CLOT|nr:PPC domain-containing DNA-binding protein [Clostridium thailandense]MBV7276883.1 DNA-binding protein [Clostridium thailandense]